MNQTLGQGAGMKVVKMRLETKGRGGKAVTVLFSLPFSAAQAELIVRSLKSLCGCGGTYKDGSIELQGDRRDQVEKHLAPQGYKIVRAGG